MKSLWLLEIWTSASRIGTELMPTRECGAAGNFTTMLCHRPPQQSKFVGREARQQLSEHALRQHAVNFTRAAGRELMPVCATRVAMQYKTLARDPVCVDMLVVACSIETKRKPKFDLCS